MFIKPYNSDYMYYDDLTNRYVLTAKAVQDYLGIDLGVQAKDNANGVDAFMKRVSLLTYRKMHEYGYEKEQDAIIATTESGRRVIQEAMLEQFFYMKSVGDLSLSANTNERQLYASDSVVDILERVIEETGRSLVNISLGR